MWGQGAMQKPDMTRQPGIGPITRLSICGDRVLLEAAKDIASPGSATLDAGSLQRIQAHLVHVPPTAGELESAIMQIEDDLMPVLRSLPGSGQLVTCAPAYWEVVTAAGLGGSPEVNLDIATVERLFNLLADVAHGMPAARLGIPANGSFAAMLLLLREILHHGGFGSVWVMQPVPASHNSLQGRRP
ncbi:MAG: hypothetical protein H6R08_1213 [Proteobacteria bacterium]|nr:hypothetical protein [Pseudomonadota bacterium]